MLPEDFTDIPQILSELEQIEAERPYMTKLMRVFQYIRYLEQMTKDQSKTIINQQESLQAIAEWANPLINALK